MAASQPWRRADLQLDAEMDPVACTTTEPLESSRGTAIRIVDDVDALDAAMEEAADHCDRYDRHAVLQSVSPLPVG
jgi:hypothetical protein